MPAGEETRAPTHSVFHVIGAGKTARWNRIGFAWCHEDEKGMTARLDVIPLLPGQCTLVIREIGANREAQ